MYWVTDIANDASYAYETEEDALYMQEHLYLQSDVDPDDDHEEEMASRFPVEKRFDA